MAIRWRKDGRLVCAMMFKAEDGDTYIDDRLTYQLAVKMNVLVADENCKTNGLWHWVEPCSRVDCGYNVQSNHCSIIPELSGRACKTFTFKRG